MLLPSPVALGPVLIFLAVWITFLKGIDFAVGIAKGFVQLFLIVICLRASSPRWAKHLTDFECIFHYRSQTLGRESIFAHGLGIMERQRYHIAGHLHSYINTDLKILHVLCLLPFQKRIAHACKNAKKKLCHKKVVSKELIEDRIVNACYKMLTDSNIKRIAAEVAKVCKADMDTATIKRIKSAINEIDVAIENLWKALESGQSVDMITERINKRQQEKKALEEQLALEISKQFVLSEPDVTDFLYKLKNGSLNNIHRRRSLINIFVGAIYLFDDKFRIILNGSEKPIEIDDVLIDEVNDYFDGLNQAKSECSHLVADARPFQTTI